jgi:hypothetical protein
VLDERCRVGRVLPQPGNDAHLVRHAHLDGVERRPLGLPRQVRLVPIQELTADVLALKGAVKGRAEAGVGCRGGVAVPQGVTIVSQRDSAQFTLAARVGNAGAGVVASGAGLGAVPGQGGVEEQELAKRLDGQGLGLPRSL